MITSIGPDPLAGFGAATREWFTNSFAAPTPAQAEAWQAIRSGEHALVIAPTGSGKTLAAFLAALDDLMHDSADPTHRCRVLYVSPLKALAVDVERNLRAPLRGIGQAAARLGQPVPDIRAGVRSGDTPASERRRLIAHPPDILITTPESLFLMLTSGAREALRGVRTVIIDEIHVLAATKRGAHLALSLERLAALTEGPVQRIGLSATVRPAERVARFLHTLESVRVVAPPAPKVWELDVRVPVDDLAAPDEGNEPEEARSGSIWPHITEQVLDIVLGHRSTIVFVNSRRLAERVTARLNELWAERQGVELPDNPTPAQLMAQSGASRGTHIDAGIVARAHHGSVSKEQRAVVEAELKSGVLRCVVATSSLELGIDMGAVDVVVQVEAPPSVASGLQRVGRAGHQVGAVSKGAFFPIHRGDLVEAALVVQRMRDGLIEEVAELENPLDVLAQQIVAITAGEPITADALFELVRRAASFTRLPRSAFEAVLDMLTGRYPSEDFAELRPRLVWDRESGLLTARPGAQRLAVTSGGTIPDRGLFGVFLVGEGAARRVGELDEEMVYESRVGDVFTLGTTSWRIEAITHDQVQVSPAPGIPGRLPFWKGDSPGRPVELGLAHGAFLRELISDPGQAARTLAQRGLDARAADNLLRYLREQQEATGALPTDTTLVLERFRDDLGDWQLCLHSGLGTPVLSAWALAIGRNAREQHGIDVQATATNDGIVIRVPDTDGQPPGAELLTFDPDELVRLITEEVGGSALFASRFRECAARALLLPRRDPRARAPLWQQRMRAAQLLEVAAGHPDFPITLETMRECLHDVFDLSGLERVQRAVNAREIRVVEVETPRPSPFARSLLFGYVGQFVYEGDTPLAERRAAALTLDTALLAELLGTDGFTQVLDPDIIAQVEAELQGLAEDRRATTVEQLFDLIRTAGPFGLAELLARAAQLDVTAAVDELVQARRIAPVRIAGHERLAVTEDLPRLVDGIGVPAPPGFGVSAADGDPVEDLVLRWARTHGPFADRVVADRYGLAPGLVVAACRRLQDAGTLVHSRFSDAPERQWCHHRVLSWIKRRTLAALRAAVEPVDQATYARFLPGWQGVNSGTRGVDGVLGAIDQLAGCAVPASMWESLVLPSRVADYAPALLDEVLAAGEVVWTGDGAIGEWDGWVRLWPATLVTPPVRPLPESATALALWERLGRGGGWFFNDLINDDHSRGDWERGLWELVWGGRVRSDTFSPVRALAGRGALKTRRVPRTRSRSGMLRAARQTAAPPVAPQVTGRWAAVAEPTPADRIEHLLLLLDRHGVVTRGGVLSEQPDGSFGPVYRGLSQLEETGQCLRGYFVDGLGAAQFATSATVDRLRDQPASGALVLAATDPANAYGAALPWPDRESGHRPGRKPGALVMLVDGHLIGYLERGAKTLLTFTPEPLQLSAGLEELAATVTRASLHDITIERVDGQHVFENAKIRSALEAAGFVMTPQGMKLRAR
ncbi:ATP-dependent helicase [Granulicoccus sp. GXG6511]|uniref:ATP-dependent helicase n=1 Tax=Granulicoccus sp. GXG6511 TaxID=3381351 RepID=UPI003D7DDEA1